MASAIEQHYDAQAAPAAGAAAGGAREALAARRSGVLFWYKLFANCVKRELITAFATDANCLVDLGCGRGGDLAKWRGAHVRHVIAIDLSSAQLDEARVRACPPSGEQGGRQGGGRQGGGCQGGGRQGGRRQGRGGRQGGTQITWKQHDFLTPSLAVAVAHDLKCADSTEGADAVAACFACSSHLQAQKALPSFCPRSVECCASEGSFSAPPPTPRPSWMPSVATRR